MAAEMSVWSYITQWVGYLVWCASSSDAACRPFVGLLALAGASGGMLTLLMIGMASLLNGWERDVLAARASDPSERRDRAAAGNRAPVPLRAEPALAKGAAAPVYAAHAEPLLPAGALAVEARPLGAPSPVAVPLRTTL